MTVGVSTNYLGRVEIVPSLNQSEYDYLEAFAASRRSFRAGGPYAVEPRDPHTGSSAREVDRYNQIAKGQPSLWCQWASCPHGCCLGWNGHEKFYAGPAWMVYLIDHFLRPGAHAQASGDPQFAAFSFDHRMDGLIVGEQQDNLELFLIRVERNVVTHEILRRGMAMPWESGWDGLHLEDRPWLASEPRPRRSSLDDPPELADLTLVPRLDPGPVRSRSRRRPRAN